MKQNLLLYILLIILIFLFSELEIIGFYFVAAILGLLMSIICIKSYLQISGKEKNEILFWVLFIVRSIILIYLITYVNPIFAYIDLLLFGISTIIIIFMGIIKEHSVRLKNNIANISSMVQPANQQELKCKKCEAILQSTDKFCPNCGNIIDSATVSIQKAAVLSSNFDKIYSLSENEMLEEFINRELTKAGVDKTSKLIPNDILKREKILNVIFSILIFAYITLIFFHFPIYTYIIGLVILFIFFKVTRKYDLIKYLKKQLKARPGEKISNIVMNVKNTFVTDNSKGVFTVSSLVAIILPLIIFSSPRIIYERVDGGYAVRYYIFGLTNFKTATIPETYKNEKVVSLRGNTFSNMPFLESVQLPDTVTEIRGQAFKNCYKLTDFNIPKQLEYLGGGAFYNAKSIKRVELPDTLTYLGGESFYGAKSLEYVKLSNKLTEIRGDSFEYCTSLKSITIPDNVTRIGGHAFYGDSSLSEVSISENSKLSEIGSSAFRQCSSLYNITIPSGTYVNERAFKESPTTINRFGYDSYNNSSNIVDDSNKSVEDYSLDYYMELANKSKHTSENYYIFKAGETIVFDKYEMIISVPRVSQNGEINYVVNATTKRYGSMGADYNNTGKYGKNYAYWNNCKILFVETENLDELKIVIQSVDELAKNYKTAVQIELTQNEKYMINNNTIGLTYTKHRTIAESDEFDISLEGVTSCNLNRCNSVSLSSHSGFEEINDNFMVKYVSASLDKLVLIIYYN